MAGHVPKAYISLTRYLIWRQIRSEADTTVLSQTLNCTFGAFIQCRRSREYWASRSLQELARFCHPWCGVNEVCGLSTRISPAAALDTFWRNCAHYDHVDYEKESEDMKRDTVRLPHAQYLQLAMSHRFCVVAPGDYPSTHKIAEAMALGGAGGCIPVFVLPVSAERSSERKDWQVTKRSLRLAVESNLPYTRWLDYCSVAYLVTEQTAQKMFTFVVDKLRAVTPAEVPL